VPKSFDPKRTQRRLREIFARVRSAVESTGALSPEELEAATRKLASEAAEIIDKGNSTRRIFDLVREKLNENAESKGYAWAVEWFADSVVFERGGSDELYMVDFEVSEGETVTLGEIKRVRRVYQEMAVDPKPVPAHETRVRTTEAVQVEAQESLSGGMVKIIQPGEGSTGNWLAETLRRDGPQAFPKGTHMYWDHPTASEQFELPERSVERLAATLAEDAKWIQSGPEGPGLYASIAVREQYSQSVRDMKDWIGVSVRCRVGISEAGDIVSIDPSEFNSVDFVTVPGAGGKVVEAFESAGRGPAKPLKTQENQKMDKEIKDAFEALTAKVDALAESTEAQVGKAVEAAESVQAAQSATDERVFRNEAREAARAAVEKADLPEAAKVRVQESILRNVPKTDAGELDHEKLASQAAEAVKQESEYLASVTGTKITGEGGSATESADDAKELFEFHRERLVREGMSDDDAKAAAQRMAA